MAGADVLVLILSHSSANGGESYKLIFTGKRKFNGVNDKLKISFQKADSDETKYLGLLRILKIGMIRYISHTQYISGIRAKYLTINKRADETYSDKWNYWVYNLSALGAFKSEQSKEEYSFKGNISADRITNESKIIIGLGYEKKLQSFNLDTIITKSIKKSLDLKAKYVKSISNHFSAGCYTEYFSSSFDNIQSELSLTPALEYDFFPYKESLTHEFTIRYKVGISNYNYYVMTIFGRNNENLFSHSLKLKYDFKEIWGTASLAISGSQFLNNLSKNRIEFNSSISLRVFEGFSINTMLNINILHDQIYLPAEGATKEEILLNQKQLASQYEVNLNLGFSYSFGSIYNNIVNTRF